MRLTICKNCVDIVFMEVFVRSGFWTSEKRKIGMLNACGSILGLGIQNMYDEGDMQCLGFGNFKYSR